MEIQLGRSRVQVGWDPPGTSHLGTSALGIALKVQPTCKLLVESSQRWGSTTGAPLHELLGSDKASTAD